MGVCGTCIDCGGPAHEASGAAYRTATGVALVCGPCVRRSWRWVRQHVNAPWRHAFYEAAARDVEPEEERAPVRIRGTPAILHGAPSRTYPAGHRHDSRSQR